MVRPSVYVAIFAALVGVGVAHVVYGDRPPTQAAAATLTPDPDLAAVTAALPDTAINVRAAGDRANNVRYYTFELLASDDPAAARRHHYLAWFTTHVTPPVLRGMVRTD